MKRFTLLLLVSAYLMPFVTNIMFSFTALANSDSDKETLYDQLIRAVVRLKEHQSICTPGLNWSGGRLS